LIVGIAKNKLKEAQRSKVKALMRKSVDTLIVEIVEFAPVK
jgi:hypothetical protein